MANEITVALSLSALKSSVMSATVGRALASGSFTMTGNPWSEGTISVATSATVIPLGTVTQPHWAWFKNLDATNFLKIRNGISGADFARLLPGEPAIVPLEITSVPYAIADTAACLLEYLILSL